jgi:predicted nuclease with TOPRIM domain
MASLSSQIEELEEELYEAHGRVRDLEEDASKREDEISDLEDQVCELEDYVEWIDATYPDARTAYEAKRRLDEASSVV